MTTTNRFRSLATAAAVLALAVPSASLATSGPPSSWTRGATPEQPCKDHWGATYTYAPSDCSEQVAAPGDRSEHGSSVGEAIAVTGFLAALVACAWFVWTVVVGRGDATARVRQNA
jgi:hypothetical protein